MMPTGFQMTFKKRYLSSRPVLIIALCSLWFGFGVCPAMGAPKDIAANELADDAVIAEAKKIVQLIATYSYRNAREQFEQARTMLVEPALTEFDRTMMTNELNAIDKTRRSQSFVIDEPNISVSRLDEEPYRNLLFVTIPGRRIKTIGAKPLPADAPTYHVKLRGVMYEAKLKIVVSDIRLKSNASSLGAPTCERRHDDSQQTAAAEKRPEQLNDDYKSLMNDVLAATVTKLEQLTKELSLLADQVAKLSQEVDELKRQSDKRKRGI